VAEIGGKLRRWACVESAGANDWRKWLAARGLSGGGIWGWKDVNASCSEVDKRRARG
jgi:hypothetical protein